jgi:hypothetical protein
MNNLRQYLHKFYVRKSKLAQSHKLASFYKKNVDRSRTRILLACMPKSGSTFLTEVLQNYRHFPAHALAIDCGRNEQEICWTKLDAAIYTDALFVQQHVRASEHTLKIIRLLNIHTIVMIRNLLDITISIRDHYMKESLIGSMAYVDDTFLKWESRRQFEFIIDMVLPWYLNFMGTWLEAGKQQDIPLLWLNYSDWVDEPEATLKKIDAFCGLSHSAEAATQAVAQARKGQIRLNVGKSGRGRELLDEALQAKVRHMLSYYPSFEPYLAQLI